MDKSTEQINFFIKLLLMLCMISQHSADLSQHFLDHHITTNGLNSNNINFALCMDFSAIVAQADPKEREHKTEMDENWVLRALRPLDKNNRKVIKIMFSLILSISHIDKNFQILQHPLLYSFINMKYNSYAFLFMSILMFKIIFAILITGLTVSSKEYSFEVQKCVNENFSNQSRSNTTKTTSFEVCKHEKNGGLKFQLLIFLCLTVLSTLGMAIKVQR